jgi:exopolysaccharide biosynthesis polyprenyl glycosylphosphotransferase
LSRASRTIGLTSALTDLLLLVAAYFVAYQIRDRLGFFMPVYAWDRYLLLPLLGIPTWLVAGATDGLYTGRRRSLARDVRGLVWAALVTGLMLASFAFLFKQQVQSRPLVVLYMGVALSQALAARLLVRLLALGQPDEVHHVVVVGSGEQADDICETLRRQRGVELVGVMPEDLTAPAPRGVRVLGALSDAETVLRREVVDEVIFVVPRTRLGEVEHAFAVAEDLGLETKLCLTFLPHRISRVDFEELDGTPVLSFSTAPGHPVKLAVKRAFDMVVSGFAIVICAPLFLLLAAAIKLDSPGPVFFGQIRSGLNGRTFRLLKFRSMVPDAEKRLAELRSQNEMSGPVFKITRDPRITRVGRILRKTSMDELPQFFNVFLGHMSIVGPRPPLPSEVVQYQRWQRRRLSVRPGITCIWQVSGRNEIDFDTWMKLDLAYIDQWSLWLDLKIFFRTIPVVLLGRGAR